MTIYPKKPILLVDDETDFLHSLALTLRLAGLTHLVECADSRQVEKLLAERDFSLVITDLVMPHLSGDQLLVFIRQNYPQLPVFVLTGMNQVELAVKCIKAGAFDYFSKTGEVERLVAGILRALQTAELQQECSQLRTSLMTEQLQQPELFADIVTVDPKMQKIFRYLEAIAPSPEPVLITGESGAGKELIARAVHRLASPAGPWVAINVAGLDDNVFSDTLFGHARGAFTGAERLRPGMIEQAKGGTLFLDEIGDLTLESQVKLLRLLQEGEYFPLGSDKPKQTNVRIVFATNRDLEQQQARGLFRKDLYYRLCAHQVELPPLRERKGDIPLLVDLFINEAAEKLQKQPPNYPIELLTLLQLYPFPGNIRELRAMVFNALSIHHGKSLALDSFYQAMKLGKDAPLKQSVSQERDPLLLFQEKLPTLKQAADLLVKEAMQRTNGNQAMAARLLGITPPSLSNRLKKNRS